jgi:hypothetical protein
MNQQAGYWLLRLFENNLLSELGYALDLSHDINGNDINKNNRYEYQHPILLTES